MPGESKMVNPYNVVGELHNEGLDYLITVLLKRKRTEASEKEVTGIIRDYLVEIGHPASKIEGAILYSLTAEIFNRNLTADENEQLERAGLGDEAMRCIREVLAVPDDRTAKALELIAAWEQRVLLPSWSEKDKQACLIFLAVAASSINYWVAQKKNPKSRWKKFLNVINKIPWKADAKGAFEIAGAEGLAALALKGPVEGTLIVIKGVAGGIVASVSDVLFKRKMRKQAKKTPLKPPPASPDPMPGPAEPTLFEKRMAVLKEKSPKFKLKPPK